MKLAIIAVIFLLAACDATPSPSISARQNLTSAQAQATNAALIENATATAYASNVARATEQADTRAASERTATAQAVKATEQAHRDIKRATDQARADVSAQIMLNQQQDEAIATKQAIDRQMSLDIAAATRQSSEIHATVTAIAKRQLSDGSTVERAQSETDLIFYVGWAIKCCLAIAVVFFVFVLIEIIRKRGSVMMVGKIPVAVDGSFVGNVYVTSLLESVPQVPMLPAPQAQTAQPNGNGTHEQKINGNIVESMSQEEADDRRYWHTRVVRFLQSAMAEKGKDYTKIPPCRDMHIKIEDWVDTTDAIGQWIIKEERKPTLCIPPYDTLEKLYDAVVTKKITPLPPHLRDKYSKNSGKQEAGEQRIAGNSSGKTAGSSPASRLDEAVNALPEAA